VASLHKKKVVGEDDIIHVLGCKVCLKFDWKDKTLVPKLNWLTKHVGKRKATIDMPRVQ
jgi:hypothetical protein